MVLSLKYVRAFRENATSSYLIKKTCDFDTILSKRNQSFLEILGHQSFYMDFVPKSQTVLHIFTFSAYLQQCRAFWYRCHKNDFVQWSTMCANVKGDAVSSGHWSLEYSGLGIHTTALVGRALAECQILFTTILWVKIIII